MEQERFSLADSWAHLGDLLMMTLRMFGTPALLAAQFLMRREDRQDLLKWLAPLEAYARRLLAIEALGLPARNDAPEFHACGHILSAMRDQPEKEVPEDAAQWRVRFVAWSGPSKRATGAPLQAGRQERLNSDTIALARRLEALRRLIENHDREVLRLARKLAAHPKEARRKFAPYRYPGPVTTVLAEAQIELEAAFAANTS